MYGGGQVTEVAYQLLMGEYLCLYETVGGEPMIHLHEAVAPLLEVSSSLMPVLWAALIGLAIWSVASLARRSHNGNVALAIAEERHLRGETR